MERVIDPAADGPSSRPRDRLPAPHDLVRIAGPEALQRDAARPPWADAALSACPWVVVRRVYPLQGLVPVGIRGASRSERWAAWLPTTSMLAVVTPQALAQARPWLERAPRVPAIAVLDDIADVLAGLVWGPAGSVGFELATGYPAANAESDLDIVVSATKRIEDALAQDLKARLATLPVRVDLAFETPVGSISLAELTGPAASRAIKTAAGPRLVRDPWAELS